ncbi:GNAT family N-acetyltransferase [Kutzneria buriramensis]|uniref:Putative GNAT family acetyltransferase n=1 Tax=Kutzneria buriramensis TaxID=1045776 RepID=A0A3E0H1H3_9PSEU|nr:GNAT family N-acetyltransferase [Kutzneria buriramensis]REH35618.1 putative GNAT family acetyltransferase [Kutzneria buriramensis]
MTTAEERVVQHVLDNPARAALLGPHSHLAVHRGQVVRYRPDVAGFVTMPAEPGPRDWQDLAALVGPGARVALSAITAPPPPGWEIVADMAGVQLTGEQIPTAPEVEAVRLHDGDVPDMLDLVARTQPGPFLPRTIEMGRYLGIRRNGRLVAMAGERLRLSGWTEVSAVCTDPAYRGQGLASRLVLAVAAGIVDRGDTPFLHARAGNTTAIRLYETLGFRLRRRTRFVAVRVPVDGQSGGIVGFG